MLTSQPSPYFLPPPHPRVHRVPLSCKLVLTTPLLFSRVVYHLPLVLPSFFFSSCRLSEPVLNLAPTAAALSVYCSSCPLLGCLLFPHLPPASFPFLFLFRCLTASRTTPYPSCLSCPLSTVTPFALFCAATFCFPADPTTIFGPFLPHPLFWRIIFVISLPLARLLLSGPLKLLLRCHSLSPFPFSPGN